MTSPSPEPARPPALAELPHFTDNLVCVVGVGRSGTTVLKNALGAHPQLIAARFEAPLERAVASSYGRHLTESPEFGEYVRTTTVASWPNVKESFRRLILEAALGNDAGRERLDEERALGRDIDDVAGWVIKVGGIWRPSIAGFNDLFAGFKPVYVHRNGIDVVESRRRFGTFADQAFEKSCTKWASGLKVLRLLQEHQNQENQGDVLVVRHEDLVAEPEQTMAELLRGLGLRPDSGPAEHLQQQSPNTTRDTDDALSVAENFANRPPAYADWTDDQKRVFVEICGPAMEFYGYDIPFA